jgi:hypothetical protein
MLQQNVCCQQQQSAGPTAIAKMAVLGYYDGPISGILQCATCSTSYKFDMLDWDDDHDIRVFRLAALPANALEQLEKIVAGSEKPHWPFWVLRWHWPKAEAKADGESSLQLLLDSAKPPTFVVAWHNRDRNIIACRRMPSQELSTVPDWFAIEDLAAARDWFAVVGLPRKPCPAIGSA